MSTITTRHKFVPPTKPESIKAKFYKQRTKECNQLTLKIRSDWNDFESDFKTDLKEFAFSWITPSKPSKYESMRRLWRMIFVAIKFTFLSATNQIKDFVDYSKAIDTLAEEILDAATRDDEELQQELVESTNQAISNSDFGMTNSEYKDWLQSVADNLYSEV